jgi:Zn-dependent protease
MRGSFKLGNVAGIGVFIHWTFAILIAFIIFKNYRAGHDMVQIAWSLLFIFSIFFTVFLHEMGHSLAAKRFNIVTKDITLLPIGGVARLESIPEKPKEELVVAIAGPMVNVILAIIIGVLVRIPQDAAVLTEMLSSGVNAGNFFVNFFIVNIWLALFNLIPAFPMDGGRVFRALLSMNMNRSKATLIAARVGQVLAMGFVFLGFYTNPFLIFIGIFIMLGAQAENEQTQAKSALRGYKVMDVLMTNYKAIEDSEPVQTAVNLLLNGQSKNFLITSQGKPVGTLSRDNIIKALSEHGENQPISNIMDRELIFLDANSPLENAFQKGGLNKSNLMPVVYHNQLVGVLDAENILEFIMVKDALKSRI